MAIFSQIASVRAVLARKMRLRRSCQMHWRGATEPRPSRAVGPQPNYAGSRFSAVDPFAHWVPVMADAVTPAVPPRKRGFFRKMLRFALVLLVLLLPLAWFAPAIVANTGLLNTVLAKVGADLNGTVTADGATLSWFGPVDLRRVTIADADGNAVLVAESVSSSRTLLQLISDRGDLGTFTVANPTVEVTVANGSTNIETLIQKYLADTTPAKPDRTPVGVELTGGTVVLREPAANTSHTLTGVELAVAVPKSRAEAITLTVAAGASDGNLGVRAEFRNGGTVNLTAARFPVGTLAPLLHRFDPTTTAEGQLTADVALSWQTVDGQSPTVGVDGTASALGVRLAGAWLGADTLALDSISAPCTLRYAGGVLAVEKSKLECDVGTVEFAGTLDTNADPEALANQAGLSLKASVDLATLAARMPKLLHIKAGTEIRSGTVSVEVASAAGKDGPSWTGTVATSKLTAVTDGKPVVWESPLAVTFAGRLRADNMPHFDSLEIRSDFLNANARGELEAFDVAVRADLGTLAAKLGEFADLGGWKLGGDATVRATAAKQPGGGFTVKGSTTCNDLVLADGGALNLNEPTVNVTYSAAAERTTDGRIRLDSADVGVTAGADKLAVNLLQPIPDARAWTSGEASVTLVGDLGRWQSRIGRLIHFPARWTLGGSGTVTGTARFDPTAYSVSPLALNLTDAVFRIPGALDLNERRLFGKTQLRYDRASGVVAFTSSELTSNTLGATAPTIEVLPLPGGEYGVTGRVAIQTNLDRLQDTLLLQSKDGSDAVRGLAVGPVTFDVGSAVRVGFTADLTVTNFSVGPPAKPRWTEPTLTVKADGLFDLAADAVTFRSAQVGRDGLAVDAKGGIGKLSSTVALNLDGTLTYDLAKVEPTLKEYLGKTASVTGKGTKPFQLTGELAGGKDGGLEHLGGNVTVAWRQAQAYGFDMGAAELGATLKDGIVYMTPVEATFGGGQVRVTPGVSLRGTAKDRFLNFAKGKIIDTAKLTPAACADAIGYALPAIANAAQADGTFSFDLDDSRIPFAAPSAGTVVGRLTVHQANVSPGPIVTQVLQAVGVKNTTVTLTNDNVVPIEFKNGRVHHRDFTMTVDGVTLKTAGSVGVDGTVKMDVEVPLSGKLAGLILPNNPRLRDALGKQSIHIPVTGTLTRPALDPNAFRGQLANLIRSASKDAATGAVEDIIKKGLNDLFKKK